MCIFVAMEVAFLFIGGPEVFIIFLFILIIFGPSKIPEIARGLGKGMRQVKDATNEIKREINDSAKNQGLDTDIVSDINNQVTEVKDNIDDLTGPIKRNM